MNPLETGQTFTIAQPPLETAPTTIVGFEFMPGYAIEREPMPTGILIANTPIESPTVPETDTAVVGEDRDTVAAHIANSSIIRPSVTQESLFEAEKSKETTEKNGFGHNTLKAVRRSRLGMYAATAITAAGAFFASHSELAKADTQPISLSPNIELSSSLHYLDGSSPVPIGAVPGEPTDPGEGTAPTSPPEAAPTDPAEVKKDCIDAALAKPKVVKAELLHVGNFDHTPLELYYFSDKYQPWPGACEGLYGNGSQARGQAFHNGRWITMANWREVNISDTGNGNWPGDIANLQNLKFPVCKARIQVKSNIVDLSVSMNPNTPWKPQHPTIAKTHFAPIPVKKILPHKPKAC